MIRGLTAILLLCAFALGVSGAPVYQSRRKDRSTPFPCQDHPCGCPDAATCWRDCCCMTHAQKLVWAREHGVTPPAFVVELAEKEAVAKKASRKSCCAAGKCCEKQEKADSCCKAMEREHCEPEKEGEPEWVTWIGRQRCRGASLSWTLFAHGIAIAAPIEVDGDATPCEMIVDFAEYSESPALAIDTPPPRRCGLFL